MLVVEVDRLDAEPLEARLAGRLHMLRPAVDTVLRLAELGGQDRLGATATGQRLAQQGLVVAPAIHVGTVEQGDAAVERVMDDADCLGVVALAIGAGERHQAESDRKDLERAAAEFSGFGGDCCHGVLLTVDTSMHQAQP
jgi:hypothetical protein